MAKVRKSLTRRTLAGVSAIALGLTGVLAASGAAFAGTGVDGTPPGNSPSATGDLIIHKYLGDPDQPPTAGNGTATAPTSGQKPLGGVDFTIWKMGKYNAAGDACVAITDLSAAYPTPAESAAASTDATGTAGGWCKTQVNGPGTGGVFTTADTQPNFGTVTAADLALGVYFVQETSSANAVIWNSTTGAPEEVSVSTAVAPFVVTVPYASKATDGTVTWLWNVNVYPKNQELAGPHKEVTGGEPSALGSTLNWEIEQTVPAMKQGATSYSEAFVWDTLDNCLAYVDKDPAAGSETLTLYEEDGTTEVTGWGEESYNFALADVTGKPQAGDPLADVARKQVKWTLTAEGRALLQPGYILKATFDTTVECVTTTGDIQNPGSSVPGNLGYGSQFDGVPVPGVETPYTYWGQLDVLKTDDANPAKPLAGAEFAVYPAKTDHTCLALNEQTGDPVATGVSQAVDEGKSVVKWTTDDGVEGSPLGLWIADSPDRAITPEPSLFYCLYETKAPNGYVTPAVTATGTPVEITPGTTAVNKQTVKNIPTEGPTLPLTGAQGTMLLILGGLGLVAVAFGAHMVIRNRQKQGA